MYDPFINFIINEPSNDDSLSPLRPITKRSKFDFLGNSARVVAVALALSSASAALAQPAQFARAEMALDRPNIFGSVALAVVRHAARRALAACFPQRSYGEIEVICHGAARSRADRSD